MVEPDGILCGEMSGQAVFRPDPLGRFETAGGPEFQPRDAVGPYALRHIVWGLHSLIRICASGARMRGLGALFANTPSIRKPRK